MLDQSVGGARVAVEDGKFRHPVNLGDLSQFKCVDCHAGKVWTAGD